MTTQEFSDLDQLMRAALAGNMALLDLLTPEEVDAWAAERRRQEEAAGVQASARPETGRGLQRIIAALGQP